MDRIRYHRLSTSERERIVGKLREVLASEGVKLAIIFGSFVEMESFRDIDVAVYLEDPDDLDRILELGAKLEEALGIPVDVVPLQSLSPRFRLKVLTRGLVVVEEPGIYEALWSQTLDELAMLSLSNGVSIP